jgi:hypothetical protein
MNFQLNYIVITMFGLENNLWFQTDQKEQKLYLRAMLYYLGFLLMAILAGIYLLYLVTSSVFIAVPAGLLLAGIVSSIVRFSLIIFRRSIFDPEKIKNSKKNEINSIINENAISQSPSIKSSTIPKITEVENIFPLKKVKDFVKGIKQFFSDRLKISLPTKDTPIPILSGIIRFLILSALGLLVLFPLACLLNFPLIEKLNEEKRQEYLNQFVKTEANKFQIQTSHLTKSIAEVENNINENKSIYQKDGMLKQKQDEVNRLKKQLDNLKINNLHESGLRLSKFQSEMSKRYFIVLSFKAIVRYPLFFLVLLIVAWLIITPHLLLYRLKTNNQFSYSLLSTRYYKDKIDVEYTAFQDFKIDYLKKNFSYSPQGEKDDVYWENPPYCTVRRQIFPKRKRLNKKEFLNSLEKV